MHVFVIKSQCTSRTNSTMHQSRIPQCIILWQKFAHVCTFLLQNGALWDVCLTHCGICEMGPLVIMAWHQLLDSCYLIYCTSDPFHKRFALTLQWRHNERGCISNHQPHDCLTNRLFRRRSKKTSQLHVTGLCAGNSPVSSEFHAQRACNAENVSIWWRHQGIQFREDIL